jgi:hypothetical protein
MRFRQSVLILLGTLSQTRSIFWRSVFSLFKQDSFMSEEPAEPLNKPERELQYFSDWNLGIGWVAESDSVDNSCAAESVWLVEKTPAMQAAAIRVVFISVPFVIMASGAIVVRATDAMAAIGLRAPVCGKRPMMTANPKA